DPLLVHPSRNGEERKREPVQESGSWESSRAAEADWITSRRRPGPRAWPAVAAQGQMLDAVGETSSSQSRYAFSLAFSFPRGYSSNRPTGTADVVDVSLPTVPLRMPLNLAICVSRYGADAKRKLANPSVSGEPEDQLRSPLENLFADLTEICGLPRTALAAVGESSLASLKTRPDFAITLRNVLVGFVEVKAPGKGADPRRYRGHDKE